MRAGSVWRSISHAAPHRQSATVLRDLFDRNHLAIASASATGLFGHDTLKSPADLRSIALQTVARARLIVNRILQNSPHPLNAQQILLDKVKQTDRLSDILCRTIDLCECIRNVHPDQEWVNAANNAYENLCNYMSQLNTHEELYKTLKAALHPVLNSRTSASLTPAIAVAKHFIFDFEKSGIHLPLQQKQQFVELSSHMLVLSRDFSMPLGYFDEEQHSSASIPKESLDALPAALKARLGGKFRESGKNIEIPLGGWEVNVLLQEHPDPEIRKILYAAINGACTDRLQTLEALLAIRATLAQLVGRQTYAKWTLADKMAKTPEHVMAFLKALSERNQPSLQTDLHHLQKIRQSFTQAPLSAPLLASDKLFYSTRNTHDTSFYHRTTPFFSVGTCMSGLSSLLSQTFGLRLEPQSIKQGEFWTSDIQKLDVIQEDGSKCGTIICDMFSRQGKPDGAAHYTVTCSRRLDDDEAHLDFADGETPDPAAQVEWLNPVSYQGGVKYQLPTIVLSCSFERSLGSGPALLSLMEVETLFHEFGHALHSMIGRTEYQNVSGTRCATDFVELPSILMEHFLREPAVLSLLGYHYLNNTPIPTDQAHQIARDLANQKKYGSGVDTAAQLTMAIFDQRVHDVVDEVDSTRTWCATSDQFSGFKMGEAVPWQAHFTHLVGYGATYYSYLFDRAIASRVYTELFSGSPLNRQAGQLYSHEILSHGGGKDPWSCISSVLKGSEAEVLAKGGEGAMKCVGSWWN